MLWKIWTYKCQLFYKIWNEQPEIMEKSWYGMFSLSQSWTFGWRLKRSIEKRHRRDKRKIQDDMEKERNYI